MTKISTAQDKERDMTITEQDAHDAREPTVEDLALEEWQAEMDAHDGKWTSRMAEDQTRLLLGETIEDLRAENNGQPIPLEWWVEEKARIRNLRP